MQTLFKSISKGHIKFQDFKLNQTEVCWHHYLYLSNVVGGG